MGERKMTARRAYDWGYLSGVAMCCWGSGLSVAIHPTWHYSTASRWSSGAIAVVGLVVHVFVSLRRRPE